jgi:Holliday junction DNA helicase RuvA
MISRLTGTVVHTDLKYVILDVGGVGYKIHMTLGTASGIKGSVTLWTHLAVRDDAMDLYGFKTLSELQFFELLISISGIGPKTALGVLNVASIEAIDNAIRTGSTAHLVKVSGIGKKMAEKIVLELKDKLGVIGMAGHSEEYASTLQSEMKNDADALEALKALGYAPAESREALKDLAKISPQIKDTGEKVKAALKLLSR